MLACFDLSPRVAAAQAAFAAIEATDDLDGVLALAVAALDPTSESVSHG